MASRKRLFNTSEALEIVMEDGSDNEEDVIHAFSDEEDDNYDLDQSTVPIMTDFMIENDDITDSTSGDTSPSPSTSSSDTASRTTPPIDSASDNERRTFEFQIDEIFDELDVAMDYDVNESSESDFMFDWCKDLTDFPIIPPFTGSPGLSHEANITNDSTPLDFYELFVNNTLIRNMKSETNSYARRCIAAKERSGDPISHRSIFRQWRGVTIAEMYKFIAILLHMSLVDKPYINDYWSKHPTMETSFTKAINMTRDRFKSILSFFHLNDNATYIPRGVENHDPLHKIRPFHDHLNQTFKAVYTPDMNICIDEALCPWRGRSHMRVYMKDKPVKWGIKIYELCESSTGYVWSFEVICGQPNLSNSPYDVTLRLISPLLNQGYCLYIDNYYCNPAICETLVLHNTMVVGTVRSNRVGLPKDLMSTPLQSGEMDFRRRNQVVALKWKDKRDVQILTTKHLPEMATHTSRTATKQKPTAVIDYTKFMSGVDRSDQLIAYTPLHRKTVKWWKKLAFHLLTLCMVQAYTLYCKQRKHQNLKHFRLSRFIMEVCLQIATLRCNEEVLSGEVQATGLDRLTGRHFPMEIDSEKKKRNACYVCYHKAKKNGSSREHLRNRVKRTEYECRDCKKSLCIPCFYVYHNKSDFLS